MNDMFNVTLHPSRQHQQKRQQQPSRKFRIHEIKSGLGKAKHLPNFGLAKLNAKTTNICKIKRTPSTPIFINNVELLKSLEFVLKTPRHDTTDRRSLSTCCLFGENSLNNSHLTYTINSKASLELHEEATQEEGNHQQQKQQLQEKEYLSALLKRKLIGQHINEVTLNNNITSYTFLSENMDGEDVSTKQNGKIDETKVQSSNRNSDEESVEEEIEIEEIIAVSEPSNQDLKASSCLDQSKIQSLNLDLSCHSSNSYNKLSKEDNKSKGNVQISADEEGQFKIDDDQLSGGKLAQHFLVEDIDEDEHTINNTLHKKKINLLLPIDINLNEYEPGLSSDNQSTTDDVSDLMEEENTKNNDPCELSVAKSIDMSKCAEESSKANTSHSLLSQTRKDALNIKPLSIVNSMHEQKDNSVDEIFVKDQSVNYSFEIEKHQTVSEHSSTAGKRGHDISIDSSENKENQLNVLDLLNSPNHNSLSSEENGKRNVEKIKIYAKDFSFIFPTEIKDSVLYSSSEQNKILMEKNLKEAHRKHLKDAEDNASAKQIVTDLDDNCSHHIEQNIEINDINKDEKQQVYSVSATNLDIDAEDDDDEISMNLMKMRLLTMKDQSRVIPSSLLDVETSGSTRPVERVSIVELANDVLEDITEESERNILPNNNININNNNNTASVLIKSNDVDVATTILLDPLTSTNILNLISIQKMEQKFEELQKLLTTKDITATSITIDKESSSLTNSTEYRTFHEDFATATKDIYLELSKRDELITKLMQSLQKSVVDRENLQSESEKLNNEVVMLRKQLMEKNCNVVPKGWSRDQESNGGQRLSEISMDLVSESDDDIDRDYLTSNDNYKCLRDSKDSDADAVDDASAIFSKQMEQYQKYLTPNEVRIFFMVQKKFDDYLSHELEKNKIKIEQEFKIIIDQYEKEKQSQQEEIQKLLNLKQENDRKHKLEMEDLRKYFEYKCADLEKQYSDDVFSQKSQRQSLSSSSETLDKDDDDKCTRLSANIRQTNNSKSSPLVFSPSHRQIIPSNDVCSLENKNQIQPMKELNQHLKITEDRYGDNEFLSQSSSSLKQNNVMDNHNNCQNDETEENVNNVNDKPSLIIIDQDELLLNYRKNNDNNAGAINVDQEAYIIQKIVAEYEKRLHEQLALAKADIARELEQQIQSLLSETTTDDQHWPKELILLREKFTAESQLEIAQLQIKHAEEMSRLKLEYEKQLNRKNKRHLTFDSIRDFDKLLDERDSLRELTKSLRHVLAQLAKFVINYDKDILDNTLIDKVQCLLSSTKSQIAEEYDINTTNTRILNNTNLHLMPDVEGLLQIVEDPSLVEYIANKTHDLSEDFDLKECLEKLNTEAAYLCRLSEDIVKHKQQQQQSEREEREDEITDNFKELTNNEKTFKQMKSLNEEDLPTYNETNKHMRRRIHFHSLSPNFNRHHNIHDSEDGDGNISEINCQLVELKNCLIKSESDRTKLQKELEHTIQRNSELGTELKQLRDQLSQLNSLNTQNYCLSSSMKTPPYPNDSAHDLDNNVIRNFNQLQEKLRNIVLTPKEKSTITATAIATIASGTTANDSTVLLLQMIEDFCREGDKVIECNRKDKEDLQSQIDIADKQLKATRQFLEEQAIEHEHERDEFLREIDKLKKQLNDKEKECSNYVKASREVEYLDTHIREINQKLQDSNKKCEKFEVELKASIDKIFVLREIITDLETQVETKAVNEHVMEEQLKELKNYINTQNEIKGGLEREIQNLTNDIEEVYKVKLKQLDEKLQNMRPTVEQNNLLDQVIEQLHEIEHTIEQKTKQLEILHHQATTYGSNSGSLCATEDISGSAPAPTANKFDDACDVNSPAQSTPEHSSPRQHCLTVDGVQRIVDKLSKHTRIEEATVKRLKDFEMHITQMKQFCTELQNERESLQERMSEQTQRITVLQNRLEEQRHRAEELQRFNSSGLNIRIHDLQTEIENLKEKLSIRDKQIATQNKQLDESKQVIDRLEAELEVNHEPDRSLIERLNNELKQKQAENQKLKEKIKNEMINKLALPDLMETMLADKNEEIDHLREQLDNREKELKALTDTSENSSLGSKKMSAKPDDSIPGIGAKLSARTLSDVVSISDYDEPDVLRRIAIQNASSPFTLSTGAIAIGHSTQNSLQSSKVCVANLTYKRSEDLEGFITGKHHANTFDNPHYFQDPNALMNSGQSSGSNTMSIAPRQINFSALTEDSKVKTPSLTLDNKEQQQSNQDKSIGLLKEQLELAKNERSTINHEKEKINEELLAVQERLTNLQNDLTSCYKEMDALREENNQKAEEIAKLTEKNHELLNKQEKDLLNYNEMEETYKGRLKVMETDILKNIEREMQEKESLRKELQNLEQAHKNCKYIEEENEKRNKQLDILNKDLRVKDENIIMIKTKLSLSEEHIAQLKQKVNILEGEIEKLKQHNSDNSSKQFSVDEIAKRVEKELNYSAQLNSNILKAIESEEENNLNSSTVEKNVVEVTPGSTDDENFVGERDLLNQLEVLKTQITVEREQSEEIRHELLEVKQHAQEIQEQDLVIIEAMRKRLEAILVEESNLHKQLEVERERCERLKTQLAAVQRSESRRNSSQQKSPNESPRKSPRSLTGDFESELVQRLHSEIKLLTAQNERERERSTDLQMTADRERTRFEKELKERIEYCEKLKREMDNLLRDKEEAELMTDHLQERLTLQTQEIESLESRIYSLQETETRRQTRKERQHKENAQLMIEIKDLKEQLANVQIEKESLNKCIAQLRCDIERSAKKESKLTEALASANAANLIHQQRDNFHIVPDEFLQKMKEINDLLAENTQENKQMADTIQYLVEERRQLQQKCEKLETQLNSHTNTNVNELEERCHHLLARYLRVESHRKALVYQKRYLKISLQGYLDSEQRVLTAFNNDQRIVQRTGQNKKKLFKIVAIAIISIQRMKYIGRIWQTGKRIVSKSIFTITRQRHQAQHQHQIHNQSNLQPQASALSCAEISSTSVPMTQADVRGHDYGYRSPTKRYISNVMSHLAPLESDQQTPSPISQLNAFEWPKVSINHQHHHALQQ